MSEEQNNATKEYGLGTVVGYRSKLQLKFLDDELKKERRVKIRAKAFADTNIEELWLSVSDVIVPHYEAKKRLVGIGVQLGQCGRLLKKRGVTYGLKIVDVMYGGPIWKCICDRHNGKINYYMQQPSPMWDETRFNFHGTQRKDKNPYDANDMRDSFVQFLLMAIPPSIFEDVQPVEQAEASSKKAKRRVLAVTD